MAIYRPYSLIGKSSNAYLFDPNIGEFKIKGNEKLEDLLTSIDTSYTKYYESTYDTSYILWAFKVGDSGVDYP